MYNENKQQEMKGQPFSLFKKTAFMAMIIVLAYPLPVFSFSFNRHNILSEQELENSSAFSLSSITKFLKRKGGILGSYQTIDLDGTLKSAAEIIFQVSKTYSLNPKFFITLFQKESGVITNNIADSSVLEEYPLGFGICDSCDKDDPKIIEKYKGFAKQVNAAGNRIRTGYLTDLAQTGQTISGWGPGITKFTVDGLRVTPKNNATAVLYTYNPWVGAYGGGDKRWGGNSLFWKIWTEWFTTTYPDGSLLREINGNGGVYVIQNEKKFPFQSRAAFLSRYSLDQIIDVSRNVIDAYETGEPIKYPQHALLRSPTGTIYLLSDGTKRGIKNYATFRKIGFNPEELIDANDEELDAIPNGDLIGEESVYPTGALLQDADTGMIVFIDPSGIRHPIHSKEILESRFPHQAIIPQHTDDINAFPKGNPVLFKDGDLVTSPKHNAVYLISKSARRPFESREVFDALGYKWSNIIMTNEKSIDLHPLDAPIRE